MGRGRRKGREWGVEIGFGQTGVVAKCGVWRRITRLQYNLIRPTVEETR